MRYKGAPVPIKPEEFKETITPKAPPVSAGGVRPRQADLFRALRRLPRRAAQGRHRQAADAGHHAARGTEYLKVFINYGTPGGMPNWGTSGELTEKDVDLMARFLQHEPPIPPEYGLKEMKATWKVTCRPTSARPRR
jgi:nitrite reductase (NO-forming)/hydroxylamine reductase